MASTINIGIAGITGKFARLLASHLLQNPFVTLRGYCRNASKVPASISSSPRVSSIIEGDALGAADKLRAFATGLDVVICCYLGDDALMVDGQKALIDACEEARVPRYVASDWALDYTQLRLGELFPKDPMIHVKAYVETRKHVKGVHVLIGGFMEPVFSPFFNVVDPATKTIRFWGEGDEMWEGTTYDNAAEFTAAVAVDREAVGLQRFIGGRATIREIAQSFEKVYGIKPTLERLGSLDDLYKQMHELRTNSPAEWYKYMPLFFMYYWINGQTYVGPETDNNKYPQVKAIGWEDYMRAHPLEEVSDAYGKLAAAQ